MKKFIFSACTSLLTITALMASTENEAVLMTVNGRPVYKSEFEYLYNKNSGQQIEQQGLDDYVDMFVNYKLKVADALENKYDTAQTFKNELAQYSAELASPYMHDFEMEKELLDEAYERYKRLIKVSHLMLNLSPGDSEDKNLARADSLRNAILSGDISWDDAVEKYSIDRGTKSTGGLMGWLAVGRFPAPFEDMAYKTPVGEISAPVNSGFGIHLIKVDAEKMNPGEVKARHILKLTARKSPEEAAKAKEQIDSIYTVLMNGADFADVARRESEDPGSKANGGELDWFSSGTMVAPFDSAAFSMAEGVISRPVETSYGWHIIEVTGRRPMKSREEADQQLKVQLTNSDKGLIPINSFIQKVIESHNGRLIEENLDQVKQMIENNEGGYNEAIINVFRTMDLPVAVVGDKEIKLKDAMKSVAVTSLTDASNGRALIASAAKGMMNQAARDIAREELLLTNADYRNLVNEYSDGILLFNISQDKVWQKAANDRDGLEAFFKAHRNDYKFDEPRFKGIVVFTSSDSLENEIRAYLNSKAVKQMKSADVSSALKEKFGKKVRAERVIAKKGENAITDYLAFGGEKPASKSSQWTNYFAFRGEIIEQPVEADDVRSKVITDYQAALEKAWIDELHSKYPVKINKDVLKTVKDLAK